MVNSLKVITLPVGQMKTNCYLLFDEKTKKTIIIDPGDDVDYINRIIADNEIKPKTIIATHGHYDHVMAVFELQKAYGIPFLISSKDEFLLKRTDKTAKYFTGAKGVVNPKPDNYIKDGDNLIFKDRIIKIIEVPGHTPGSVAIYIEEVGFIFTGDLIFENGGIGSYDHNYSDKSLLFKSIKKIMTLSGDVIVYPGHGSIFSLNSYNPKMIFEY